MDRACTPPPPPRRAPSIGASATTSSVVLLSDSSHSTEHVGRTRADTRSACAVLPLTQERLSSLASATHDRSGGPEEQHASQDVWVRSWLANTPATPPPPPADENHSGSDTTERVSRSFDETPVQPRKASCGRRAASTSSPDDSRHPLTPSPQRPHFAFVAPAAADLFTTPPRRWPPPRDTHGQPATAPARTSAAQHPAAALAQLSPARPVPPPPLLQPYLAVPLQRVGVADTAVDRDSNSSSGSASESRRRRPRCTISAPVLTPAPASACTPPGVLADRTPSASATAQPPVRDAASCLDRAQHSHRQAADLVLLRVCTLSGVTLRVTVDRRLRVTALVQAVADYLHVRADHVQLTHTRTGASFTSSAPAAGAESAAAAAAAGAAAQRLCDVAGLQPEDVFVVRLRPTALLGASSVGMSTSPSPTRPTHPRRRGQRQTGAAAVAPGKRRRDTATPS